MSARLNDTSLCESKFGFLSTCAPAQALPRPEDLVAGLAMAEHEGAVYEDSMVRCLHHLAFRVVGFNEKSMLRCRRLCNVRP